MQFLYDRASDHCDNKTEHNINNCYLCAENANE